MSSQTESTEISSLPLPSKMEDKKQGHVRSSRGPWKWRPTSAKLLEEAEGRILSKLKTPYTTKFVDIGPMCGESRSSQIRTISMNQESDKTPIVLLHGFGAGIAHWVLNFDTLATTRPVHAIDHLGFARSSRPKFSTQPAQAELQFVAAIEEWRKKMGLEKFVLIGHSLGGFLAMSYTLSFPNRVSHLVLADPWGFTDKQSSRAGPFLLKVMAAAGRPFNPFAVVRAAGPMGQGLIEKALEHLIKNFAELNTEGDVKFGDYVYHCNVQPPSGEVAFRTMMDEYKWAKLPMVKRLPDLSPEVDVTTIWGSKSFLDRISLQEFQQLRQPGQGYTNVQIFEGSGHDVYAEAKDDFHHLVLNACSLADAKSLRMQN